MKRNLKNTLLFLSILLAGCSKNINLDLPTPTPEVVVEGHIEPNSVAYLYLSHSFAFFGSTTISSIIANDVIHGAKISISDGSTTDSMREVIPTLGYYE